VPQFQQAKSPRQPGDVDRLAAADENGSSQTAEAFFSATEYAEFCEAMCSSREARNCEAASVVLAWSETA